MDTTRRVRTGPPACSAALPGAAREAVLAACPAPRKQSRRTRQRIDGAAT